MPNDLSEADSMAGLAGKYLTFVLGHECYGVPVLKVREIIRLCDITPVPQMPDYIKGVLNLRGKIIPVADLRMKFRLAKVENTKHTCIVVVQVVMVDQSVTPIGLIVDAVEEVLNLGAGEIEPPPDFGTVLNTDYVLGMAKVKGAVKTLLDIDRVVNAVHSETAVVAGVGGKGAVA
jgi:purine-binding chemotaxis protein CheW